MLGGRRGPVNWAPGLHSGAALTRNNGITSEERGLPMQLKAVRRAFVVGLSLCVTGSGALWVAPHAGATAPVVSPVITGKIPTISPAATNTYFAWTAFSRRHKGLVDTFVKKFGSGRKAIKAPPKIQVWSGGIADDTFIVQLSKGRGISDLGLVDLRHHKLKKRSPPGLDTGQFEWQPTIDADDILFGRTGTRPRYVWKILLYDRSSHHITTLDSAPGKCRCLIPGQVLGNYATWTRCPSSSNCSSYYYDISAHMRHQIPKTPGTPVSYYAVPNGSGTFYSVQSGAKCTSATQIVRWVIGDPAPTAVATMPPGVTVWSRLYATTGGGSQDQVYFDRGKCKNGNPDIYMIDDANARTVPSIHDPRRHGHDAGSESGLPLGRQPQAPAPLFP